MELSIHDGDGGRVKAVVAVQGGSTTTTRYIGSYYEVTVGGGNTRYYFQAGQLFALRRAGYASSNGLRYVFQDHLRSTTVLVDDSRNKVWEDQFLPYGKVWYHWDSGSVPLQTPYRFTGQRYETSVDLYDYGARFYDQLNGRFTQPDSIILNPGNPQDLNRYSYSANNPLRYSDPTGHYIFEGDWVDPTTHNFPTGPYTHASTYFLSPADAQAVFGVDTPMRVSMATVNDPTGIAGMALGLYAMSPGSSDYRMPPGFFGISGAAVPRTLTNDVWPDGGWAGVPRAPTSRGVGVDSNAMGRWAEEQAAQMLPIEKQHQPVKIQGQRRVYDGYYEGSRADHVELKTSGKGVVGVSGRIRTQIGFDALTVQQGDTVTWMFVNARPSSCLMQEMSQAGVYWHQLNVPPWAP